MVRQTLPGLLWLVALAHVACDTQVLSTVVFSGDSSSITDRGTGVDDIGTEPVTTDSATATAPIDTDVLNQEAVSGLVGYAAVNALDQKGTTGGGTADPVLVTTGEALIDAIETKKSRPLVIHVAGRITHPDGRVHLFDVHDVSIIGLGSDAELDGLGITIEQSSNIIIQNLKIYRVREDRYSIEKKDGDGIRITGQSHHVWVDHCAIHNDESWWDGDTPYDSLLDISERSTYITVSWSRFYIHSKPMFIGVFDGTIDASDGQVGRDSLWVTWHHNLFRDISPTMLSFRFGDMHVYNNQFEWSDVHDSAQLVAISSRMEACVRIEQNQFINIGRPVLTHQDGFDIAHQGRVQLLDNDYGNYQELDAYSNCELDLPYTYAASLNSVAALPHIISTETGPM